MLEPYENPLGPLVSISACAGRLQVPYGYVADLLRDGLIDIDGRDGSGLILIRAGQVDHILALRTRHRGGWLKELERERGPVRVEAAKQIVGIIPKPAMQDPPVLTDQEKSALLPPPARAERVAPLPTPIKTVTRDPANQIYLRLIKKARDFDNAGKKELALDMLWCVIDEIRPLLV